MLLERQAPPGVTSIKLRSKVEKKLLLTEMKASGKLQQLELVFGLVLIFTFCIQMTGASCVPGRYYCGTQVAHLIRQIKRAQNMTIYICDVDGKTPFISHVCPEGCKVVANGNAFCLCKPNKRYCGHEISEFRTEIYDGHSLYACEESGTNFSLTKKCQHRCIDGSPSMCSQTCTEGKFYCGYYLKELGWQGHDISADFLYQCIAGGMNISLWKRCPDGCDGNKCKCREGVLYCGHELYHQLRWTNTKDLSLVDLFQCTSKGSTAKHMSLCSRCIGKNTTATCDGNSSSALDPECQPSRCVCTSDFRYCGHELFKFGWRGYENHTLYQCDDGDKAETLETCDETCHWSKRNSFCGGKCPPGNHCGYRLMELGFEGFDNDTIYTCNPNAMNITAWATCTPGTCDSDSCKCVPGRFYCGNELYSDMGWIDYKVKLTQMRQCMADSVSTQFSCFRCVGARQRLTCQCEPGAPCSAECQPRTNTSWCECVPNAYYCGYNLSKLGWQGFENNTLYKCHGGGNNVDVIQVCKNSCIELKRSRRVCRRECLTGNTYCGWQLKEMGWEEYDGNNTLYHCNIDRKTLSKLANCTLGCVDDECKCEPSRYYCGHELYSEFGWIIMKQRQNELHLCSANGMGADDIIFQICTTCIRGDTDARCQCTPGATCDPDCQPSRCACIDSIHYCGHELARRGWQGYHNQTLYDCYEDGTLREVEKCMTSCRRIEDFAQCVGQCSRGQKYCGFLLYRKGYRGYANESLYLCVDTHLPLTDTGESNIICQQQQCIPERSYCGHEIAYIWGSRRDQNNPDGRYICQDDGSFRFVHNCVTCVIDDSGAHCACIPGKRYCARILKRLSWSEKSLLTNDTIIRCKESGHESEVFETCPPGECRGDYNNAHCLCTGNRMYCGHELYEHYNSDDTYLYSQNIYRCSENRQAVMEEETCISCFRLHGSPQCRQECTIGRYYCGSDLLSLEGWQSQDVDVNWLYKCDNSTIAHQITECSHGCIPASSDPERDAYCAAPKTPWYWFLIGIGVPVIVIGFGLILVVIGLNHRRLKRSIEASRIDASQLVTETTRKPLGKGQFGVVLQATYKPREGNPIEVAIKVSQGKTNDAAKLECADCFLREVITLDILKHENIIKAFGICTNYKDKDGNTVPALVLEYINGGCAISYMRSERHRLIGFDLLQIVTDICQGGAHLCKMGIIHRDIGARNVLVQKDPSTGRAKAAKLTDFGLAKDIGKLTSIYKSTHPERNIIHCRYTAPEGFRAEFSSKSDVWSFAVLIWELYTVLEEDPTAANAMSPEPPVPYSEIDDWKEVIEKVRDGLRLTQPKRTPDQIYRKILQCWDKIPEARPSFKELVRFFSSMQGASVAQLIAPLPSASVAQAVASLQSLPNGDDNMQNTDIAMEARGQPPEGYSSAHL